MLTCKVGLQDSGADRVFFSSRLTLLIGFGGLLWIMALVGVDALSVLQQFRRNDEQITRQYLSQDHVLNDMRSDVYISGTYVSMIGMAAAAAGYLHPSRGPKLDPNHN